MTETLPTLVDAADLDITADDQVRFVSGRIRAYCGWHIFPSITSEVTLDADGSRVLLLPTLHMTGLVSVTIIADSAIVDPAELNWSEAGMVHRRGWRWPCEFRSVLVEFVHGYATLPDELAEVAIGAAKRMPAQMASVSQEAAGGVSRSYGGLLAGSAAVSAGWTMSEQMVLDRYRLPMRP